MANKLTGKIFIKGRIKAETGLHIGGSKSSLDIGGVDLNVIKTPFGIPFIPGSSIKGKLRSMLARLEGSNDLKDDPEYMQQIFGSSGDQDDSKAKVTRLIVRDAFLDNDHFLDKFKDAELDFKYSYVKWENRINRRTGTAIDPRQLERVPAKSEFNFEFVYDVYSNEKGEQDVNCINKHRTALLTAMRLLQDDYLGGQGSRGYGQISFTGVSVTQRTIDADGKYSDHQPASEWADFANKFQ